MSPSPELDRDLRSWLREDSHESADRVLFVALDVIATTPQRRAGWPAWRFPSMNSTVLRIGVAAVAVIVAAFLGFYLLGGSNVGPPAPSPIPSVAASPAGLPAVREAIPPGRYRLTQASIPFSVAISSELWQSSEYSEMIETRTSYPQPGYAWITFLRRLDAVSIDPCAGTETAVTSMDDAATALTGITGTDAAAPAEVAIGGVPAKLVVLTIDGDFACGQNSFWLFGNDSFYPNDKDSVIRDWVFDLDGQTYLLHTDQIGTDAMVGDDIEQIIGSIQFE